MQITSVTVDRPTLDEIEELWDTAAAFQGGWFHWVGRVEADEPSTDGSPTYKGRIDIDHHDGDTGEFVEHCSLNPLSIVEAIDKTCKAYPHLAGEIISDLVEYGTITDAISADVVIQVAVFGEIIYG